MLERPVLLLRPSEASSRRPVVAADGAPLGFAERRPAAPGWWGRLLPSVLAVHEHEDEPLLFTVRRCWTPLSWREVRDADGRWVGALLGAMVQDRYGRKLAELRREADGWTFRGADGHELARLSAGPEGLRLAFSDAELDPFAKMLLLAAALHVSPGR